MEADASAERRTVKITLETASDLVGALARPECVGLQDYWFGAIEITQTRLQASFSRRCRIGRAISPQ